MLLYFSMTKPQPLSPVEAKAQILAILEDGEVKLSAHLRRERMGERTIIADDIRIALSNGEILQSPEWEEKHQNWKYRVEGKNLEGEELIMITVIITKDLKLIVITAF